jgi:hypothetical protein
VPRVDAREERLAKNEVIFRDLNERIADIAAVQDDDHVYEFLCECSNTDCTRRLPLTLAVYEDVRKVATQFVVAPGHDLPEIEDVVSRRDGYQVVTKRGEAGALVEEEDPRS